MTGDGPEVSGSGPAYPWAGLVESVIDTKAAGEVAKLHE